MGVPLHHYRQRSRFSLSPFCSNIFDMYDQWTFRLDRQGGFAFLIPFWIIANPDNQWELCSQAVGSLGHGEGQERGVDNPLGI